MDLVALPQSVVPIQIGPAALMPDLVDGAVPAGRRYAPIATDTAAGFGENQHDDEEHETGEDRQDPKDPRPPELLRDHTAQDGTDCRAQRHAHGRIPNVLTPLRARRHVGDHGTGDGDGAAAARALHASKQGQRRVIGLHRQPDVGRQVDGQAAYVRRPSSLCVRKRPRKRRGEALEDLEIVSKEVSQDCVYARERVKPHVKD